MEVNMRRSHILVRLKPPNHSDLFANAAFHIDRKRFMVPRALSLTKGNNSRTSKGWRKLMPLEGGLTRYISTRGEAPTLGFCDVMLTGLARDGGLYVPESWPQLSPDTIAGFFGRPYWEVAGEGIGAFFARGISEAHLCRPANQGSS